MAAKTKTKRTRSRTTGKPAIATKTAKNSQARTSGGQFGSGAGNKTRKTAAQMAKGGGAKPMPKRPKPDGGGKGGKGGKGC
jgi:hypothetical protein